MHVLKTIVVIAEVLILFNILIFVHELGHFLAARWRGLKIDRFAVWFGKPIWKTKINGVEYALGCIPAGGYVALPQMAPMELIEGKGDGDRAALPNISPLDKIIVAVAGPAFSFLLAFTFAAVVWVVGRPVSNGGNSTTIGWVEPNGPAWNAGLRPGDKILEIDGQRVTEFAPPSPDSVTWRIISSEGATISFKYDRDGHELTTSATPFQRHTEWYERKALRQVLIGPVQPAIIYELATNSPAAAAGLKSGDEVVAINGQKIFSPEALQQQEDEMTNHAVKPVTVTVKRDGKEFDAVLMAEKPVKPAGSNPSFGITAWLLDNKEVLSHPTPWEQISDSAGQIFQTVSVVASRHSHVGVQQLGGAVMIMRLYSNLFDDENGWRKVLWFSVILNVNLALLNMLPFPVLDGGHITLALIEVIRRRPVSARLLNSLQSACAVVLIAFMLFIAFFDTGDWVRSARHDRDQPVEFAPKN